MKKRLACWGMALLMLWGGQAMAQSAVVDNGSDPSSRLNMRDQPSKDAGSVGQFYTGTPVEIVSDAGGGWSQVTIGGGANSLSGYMMSQYLSTDTASVQDATKDMQVVSPYGTQSVVVRDTPSNSYDAVSMLEVGDDVRVIDGPLSGFIGVVDELEPDKNKVRVVVSMFGRETPVELELDQVETLDE